MVVNLLQHGRGPLLHGCSPKKSYIFSVIRTATMVAVLRKRLRPWSQSLEKTATMAPVLIKTLRLNRNPHIKLRP